MNAFLIYWKPEVGCEGDYDIPNENTISIYIIEWGFLKCAKCCASGMRSMTIVATTITVRRCIVALQHSLKFTCLCCWFAVVSVAAIAAAVVAAYFLDSLTNISSKLKR
uniref:Uncharacterized protein n=1 Tax=Glossina brevipalpis TaxID=37001 RepID=A0A1A9W200_9MUSC